MTLVPSSEMTCASLMYSEIQMAVIVLQVCVLMSVCFAIWHTEYRAKLFTDS